MATRDEIYQAIRNADAAGDADSVRKLGSYLQTMQPQAQPAAPKAEGNAALDAGNAVGTGYTRGLVRMAGLPVDTAANLIDIPKAIGGSILGWINSQGPKDKRKFSEVPPEWLQVGDRKQQPGTSDWMIAQAEKTAPGRLMLDAQNPEYQGGYLQNAGSALSALVRPQTWTQAGNQVVNALTSATAGKAVGDATGNQALAITAGMSPTLVQNAATAGAKRIVRGDEAGRKVMEQRIQDLKNAGVENPTLGLASGNGFVGGVENLLQNAPGAVGIMRRAREGAINGLSDKTTEAAQNASTNRGALAAGEGIQKGIGAFREGMKDTQNILYDKLGQLIPAATPTVVGNTRDALYRLTQIDQGAPNISGRFVNGKINDIRGDFDLDAGLVRPDASRSTTSTITRMEPGTPQVSTVKIPWGAPKSKAAAGGEGSKKEAYAPSGTVTRTIQTPQVMVEVPVNTVTRTVNPLTSTPGEGGWRPPQNPTLPYSALAKLRTQVGEELANNGLIQDAPSAQWKQLYAGMSEDMRGAANATSPQAANAFNRANDYTRAGMDRLERVAPFADKKAPEQAYTALANTLNENTSTFQAVKKTLPEGARGQVAGTVIERLGKARNGVQNDAGDVWSPDTFLTNWNKMVPKAREELLSGFPNSAQVKADIEAAAKATSMMRDNSKIWANPSGTGANLAARGTIGAVAGGGLGAAMGLVSPAVPLLAGGAVVGSNLLARGLTNKKVVNSFARPDLANPELTASQINALVASGLIK